MYQNFVNLTDAMKKRALPLITMFGFPIRLPDFYIPEKGQMDALQECIMAKNQQSNQETLLEISKQLRGAMNRD